MELSWKSHVGITPENNYPQMNETSNQNISHHQDSESINNTSPTRDHATPDQISPNTVSNSDDSTVLPDWVKSGKRGKGRPKKILKTSDDHNPVSPPENRTTSPSPSPFPDNQDLSTSSESFSRRSAAKKALERVNQLSNSDNAEDDTSNNNTTTTTTTTMTTRRRSSSSTSINNQNNSTISPPPPKSNSRKKSNSSSSNESPAQTCCICQKPLSGSLDKINSHIDKCLSQLKPPAAAPKKRGRPKKKSNDNHEDDNEDVDDFDDLPPGVETYTWAGETRIRTCTLVEDGYLGMSGERTKKKPEDEEGELDITEEDDFSAFGQHQFTEADIVRKGDAGEKLLRRRMMEDLLSSSPADNSTTITTNQQQQQQQQQQQHKKEKETKKEEIAQVAVEITEPVTGSVNMVIESLKSKIRDLQKASASFKCSVCLDQYEAPLVSVNCWHVHCEKCWLTSLGAKKLCPQCNTITSATHLRRIYL